MSVSTERMGRFKYSRTPHLPFSESSSSDDNWLNNTDHFSNKQVIISEKLDGECTSLYSDYIHARSIDSGSHPCRTRIRSTWGKIRHEIPTSWRICGENMEAAHSIWYLDLENALGKHSLFSCFGIYDQDNVCLSWADTLAYCEMLGLWTPPILYQGIWDEERVRGLWKSRHGKSCYTTVEVPQDHQIPPKPWRSYTEQSLSELRELPMSPTGGEGYVVRLADSFHYEDFSMSLAKMVRKNHVQTDSHWMSKPVLPNLTRNL